MLNIRNAGELIDQHQWVSERINCIVVEQLILFLLAPVENLDPNNCERGLKKPTCPFRRWKARTRVDRPSLMSRIRPRGELWNIHLCLAYPFLCIVNLLAPICMRLGSDQTCPELMKQNSNASISVKGWVWKIEYIKWQVCKKLQPTFMF